MNKVLVDLHNSKLLQQNYAAKKMKYETNKQTPNPKKKTQQQQQRHPSQSNLFQEIISQNFTLKKRNSNNLYIVLTIFLIHYQFN